MKVKNLTLQPSALLAELVGTFILVIVAVTVANPIIVGFTLLVLVLAIGSISGAHVNPAVTFGLWSVKKLDGKKLPVYWLMQFTGAVAALLIAQWYQGAGFGLSFASFGSFEAKIFVAELLGTAVFVYAVAAAVERNLADSAKALCIGLGLLTGLAVGGGLLGAAAQSATSVVPGKVASRIAKIDGVTLNPAVALASTEKATQQQTMQSLGAQAEQKDTTPVSRLTWETVIGTLLGGAIGANLYMLTAGINPHEKKKSVKNTVTRIIKKGKK